MILCQACSPTLFFQTALKEDIPRWPKKTGMGVCLGDNDHDCLTNVRVADNVLLCASSKRSDSKNAMRISSKVQKRSDSEYILERRKSSGTKTRKIGKEIEIDNIKVEILTREGSTKYLGQIFPAAGDDRNQKSHQGCLGNIPQVQPRVGIEIFSAWTSTSLVRHSGLPDEELHFRNLDPHKRT